MCSFALGMVLWCLSAGRTHPWADAAGRLPGAGPLIARVLRGERPDLAALRPDTAPGLRALIERCWAADPAARPTAPAIAKETASWLQAPAPWDARIRLLEAENQRQVEEIRSLRDAAAVSETENRRQGEEIRALRTAAAVSEAAILREQAAAASAREDASRHEKAAAVAVWEATRREEAAAAAVEEASRRERAASLAIEEATRREKAAAAAAIEEAVRHEKAASAVAVAEATRRERAAPDAALASERAASAVLQVR